MSKVLVVMDITEAMPVASDDRADLASEKFFALLDAGWEIEAVKPLVIHGVKLSPFPKFDGFAVFSKLDRRFSMQQQKATFYVGGESGAKIVADGPKALLSVVRIVVAAGLDK